jgi:hypothetical protein
MKVEQSFDFTSSLVEEEGWLRGIKPSRRNSIN